jgi:NADPH:quinone reductase-like Zn-dependent oxidoreductase
MGTRVMKAAVCRRPTLIGALTITDTDVPAVREDSLLVRVRASSANPVDLYALTPVAHLQRSRKPAIVGTDFAGTVESVGRRVTRYRPGDEIFGGVRGAFAEYAAVGEDGAVARNPLAFRSKTRARWLSQERRRCRRFATTAASLAASAR